MYSGFQYCAPTKVIFGKDTELQAAKEIKAAGGTKAMLLYGGQSAARSGLLSRIKRAFAEEALPYAELGGVVPNPRLETVYKGIELGKRENVDFILAVGGGSVIDSAKAIGYGLANAGDVWDFFLHTRDAAVCLPVGSVLTIAAAGSEMSNGCVITNEKTGEKRAYDAALCRPRFAILNPALTLTLPEYQTASGAVDILMHTMERYFNRGDNMEITDAISEALMRTVMRYARELIACPLDYKARAEMMWAGSLSHNGLTGCGTDGGDWACHNMEHELGGMFDVAHGAGLAAIWGSWARYVCAAAPARFKKFAIQVLGVHADGDDMRIIADGICEMERFYRQIHMPTSLRELGVAPTDAQIAAMADSCRRATGGTNGCVIPLTREDMIEIYTMARD